MSGGFSGEASVAGSPLGIISRRGILGAHLSQRHPYFVVVEIEIILSVAHPGRLQGLPGCCLLGSFLYHYLPGLRVGLFGCWALMVSLSL
jgi:hypothetical protein